MEMKKWWDVLCSLGPKYGYNPLPKKTILIVKPEFKLQAEEIFKDTKVRITTEGERHMGAVIGSHEFRETYVSNKVAKWVEDVEGLSSLAKDEPQAVYSCFTKAISHRWTYVQRTIPDISHLFRPLEAAIREKLIPALVGRTISDVDRRIFALPVRLGGMGIADPTKSSDEFAASIDITENLSRIIRNQESDFTNYDTEAVKARITEVKAEKEARLCHELAEINEIVDDNRY